nr:MAG TPA_asm: hypothetical protein [Caudoviricetes sp.]
MYLDNLTQAITTRNTRQHAKTRRRVKRIA